MSAKKPGQDATLSKKLMIEALENKLGIVTQAAKEAGINRKTHYRWYETDPDYKLAVDGIQDMTLDFAENALYKQIKEGNTASTIFLLKCRGKKRGYRENDKEKTIKLDGTNIIKIGYGD